MRWRIVWIAIALGLASMTASDANFSMVQVANNTVPPAGFLLDGSSDFLLNGTSTGKLIAR